MRPWTSLQAWGNTQRTGSNPPTTSWTLPKSSAKPCQCCRWESAEIPYIFFLIIFAWLRLPESLEINFIVVFSLFQQLNIDVVHCLLCSPSLLSEFPRQFLCAELHWDADRHQCRQNEGDTQQLLWVSIWRSYFCKLQIRGLAHFSDCTGWL